ncbi:HutD family protein [Phyllobacterium salinisoli]|uniref:HutD family protein n=1 Tax=Phyllobacterium salinisoli TaxID=1899321 RepID=A0A368K979_9HYPH|nr:HutD family protein [Phyllobacterium salinisoli]RCS25918.1 HutD family protein [Phyllobacterium salinisoli]
MVLLKAEDYRRMPWKNGGGETTEIAVVPQGAGLADFDWRVSMAKVASDGPFSHFPGIDRTLAILDGNGLELAFGNANRVFLDADTDPLPFPADIAVDARLSNGLVTDLNVMTRRGAVVHRVSRFEIDGTTERQAVGSPTLVLCHSGTLAVETGGVGVNLSALDCAQIEASPETSIRLSGKARCFVIDIVYE